MNILNFLISIFLTFYFVKLNIPILSKYLLAKPNDRSSHEKAVPSGGGLSFVLVGSLINLFDGFYLPLILLPLSLIGFLDDIYDISSKIRYFFQFLTSIIMIFLCQNYKLVFLISDNKLFIGILILMLSIVITGLINLTNFMDGIDGLVAGCMVIIFTFICYSNGLPLIPFIGSLIGFLILNWSPAKIFMGDSGSTFLGGLYAICVINAQSLYALFGFLLINFPLLADGSFCILRRFLNNENIFKPHKKHLYQRLHQTGWSHKKVSLLYLSATLSLSIVYLFNNIYILSFSSLIVFIVGLYLDYKVAKPFYLN